MKFTIIFNSHESYDFSYGLVFIPCPVFIQGKKQIINLNSESPEYKIGSIKRLIDLEKINEKLSQKNKKSLIIIHQEGQGTQQDLENLKKDLEQEGFIIKLIEI